MTTALTRTRPVLVAGLMVLLGSLLAAMLPWLTGREPALSVLRTREREREAEPELLAAIREEFQLPASPGQSLEWWWSHLLRGDLGTSWVNPNESATSLAFHGLPVTISLTLASVVLGLLLAVGILVPSVRATARGAAPRPFATAIIAALAAIPDFIWAIVLLWAFALHLGWLPTGGWSSPIHMVAPVVALGLGIAGSYGRVLLISADHALAEEWVETWRYNGVGPGVITRHLMARAFVPTIPLLSLYFAGTLTATAAIEVTFNIPGFGRTVVEAARAQDIPVIQAAVLMVLIIGTATGLAAYGARRALSAPLGAGDATGTAAAPTTFRRAGHTWLLVLAALPVLAALLGLGRDGALHPERRLAGQTANLPLGADNLGRDIWARLADGAVSSIGVAVAVTAACAAIAIVLAHAGDWVQQLGDSLNALPSVLIGLILAGVVGGSTWTAALAIMLVGWIPLAAHGAAVAAETATTAHYRYAELMGAKRWHLLRYHVLPTTVPAIIRHGVGRIAHNAIAIAALGYLGVGATVGSGDWGVMIGESVRFIERAPWMTLGPTLCLISLGIVTALLIDRRGR